MNYKSALLNIIAQHAPETPALADDGQIFNYSQLLSAVDKQIADWAALLGNTDTLPTMALAVENSPAWVIVDLAAMECGLPLVPLPFFFSPAQWLHAIDDAGVSLLITDQPQLFTELLSSRITNSSSCVVAGKTLTLLMLNTSGKATLPAQTSKITYTSGTTGNPKGVCLSNDNMLNVARSIVAATQHQAADTHLCVLPLATLLENVAGVYASLLVGAKCVLLPNAQMGLSGASGLDVAKLLAALQSTATNTAIFTPELLHALVISLEMGGTLPEKLKFLAVGGASVSPDLLKRAHKVGLPVYEGYGLSECASVVALNVAGNNKPGAVGKPLPHISISFTDEQEVVVNGNAYLGYVGQDTHSENKVYTGDIGYLDAEGYLVINGRKKNIFITSFGRNVSPEWVERELKISPFIAQAALYGEARPWNIAVIVPRANASDAQIAHAIDKLNAQLPDYARVGQWLRADAPFSTQNQQLTSNGRNRRDRIWLHYQDKINALYEGKSI